MPGIADVQPKSIGQISIPVLPSAVVPQSMESAVSATLPETYQAYANMFDRYKNKPVVDIQRREALQQGQEALDPAAIEARKAAVTLAGAQANQQKGMLDNGAMVQKHKQYFPTVFGANGKEDFDAEAHSGLAASQAEARLSYAQAGIHRNPIQYIENGVQKTRWVNDLGDDITPNPDGSPNKMLAQYQKIRNDAFMSLHSAPQFPGNTPGAFAPEPDYEKGDTAPSSVVKPEDVFPTAPVDTSFDQWKATLPAPIVQAAGPINPSEARAWLVNAGTVATPVAANMSDADVMGAYDSMQQHLAAAPAVVQPLAAPAAAAPPVHISTPGQTITVTPTAQPPALPVIQPPTDNAMVTGYAPGYSPPETVKTLRDTELYKNWAEKSAVMGRFRAAIASYTGAKGEITTQKDIALANAALQLQAPGGGGSGSRGAPEMRVNSLEEAQPLLEQFFGLKAKVLKTHKFEEGTRNRLIELGNQSIQALEGPARGMVSTAVGQLKQVGATPGSFLSPDELGLLQGAPTGGASAQTPRGRLITLPSGKRVYAQ